MTSRLIARMSISAFMMGLSIVLARFCSFYVPLGGMPSMRLSLGNLPILITSLVCGPIWGMLVGAGSDLMGAVCFPIGAYFFGYTIDSAISGLLPWVTYKILHGRKRTELVYSVLLNVVALVLSITYIFTHDSYSNGKSNFKYEFDFSPTTRIVLSLVLVALAVTSFGMVLFVQWNRDGDRKAHMDLESRRRLGGDRVDASKGGDGYSLLDIYSIFQTSAMLVTVALLPYWNQVVMSLPYFYGVFNNLIFMWLEGPIKVIIYWMVLNALKKASLSEMDGLAKRSYSTASTD